MGQLSDQYFTEQGKEKKHKTLFNKKEAMNAK
jgi:hypothetical protein